MRNRFGKRYTYSSPKMRPGFTEPKILLQTLGEPEMALAAAVVLQAAGECTACPDAHDLLFSSWFSLFADALESEPQRLRARLGVSGTSAAPALT